MTARRRDRWPLQNGGSIAFWRCPVTGLWAADHGGPGDDWWQLIGRDFSTRAAAAWAARLYLSRRRLAVVREADA